MPLQARREPILTIPRPMIVLLVIMFAIHGIRTLLPGTLDEQILWSFGFVPARYDTTLMAEQIPGGVGAVIWSFLTYSLLHADLAHIGFNMLWMLPFGSAVARRCGRGRTHSGVAAVTCPAKWPGTRLPRNLVWPQSHNRDRGHRHRHACP